MIHVFEKAGLGVAPFRFVGVEERRGPIQISATLFVGAPGQPMGSCQLCGTGIADKRMVYRLEETEEMCSLCDGSGTVKAVTNENTAQCWRCHGTGNVATKRRRVADHEEWVTVEIYMDEQAIKNEIAENAARNGGSNRAVLLGGLVLGKVIHRAPVEGGAA